MKLKKRLAVWLLVSFLLPILLATAASAAYYNTYTTAAAIGNGNGCNAMQGFAVGTTNVYSVKINDGGTKAVLYRTNMSTGATTLMTNGDDSTTYCTYLGHANDMTICSIDDVTHLFVVTMNAGSLSLVKLKVVGTTFYKVGSFTLKYNGANVSMSGVNITGKTSDTISFLFKSGKDFYRGAIGLTSNSGAINLTEAFHLNVEDAQVNGSTISNSSSYVFQGFGYSNNKLYVPMTYENVSIVLVYENISTAAGTIYSSDALSFRITSSAYPDLFEIESCGIADGRLYFNCNRRTSSGDTAHDAVCYFNDYST